MMRTEAKATCNTNRSSSCKSCYIGYGLLLLGLLLLGSVFVLLYLMVSIQFSYSPKAVLDRATINTAETIPAKHERNHPEQEDVSGGMEEFSREEEVAEANTEPSTTRRQEKPGKSEQQWAEKNPIEEQLVTISVYYSLSSHNIKFVFSVMSGNEMNTDNWEEKNQAKKEETVESNEFGGGTDDNNNVANTKPICDTSFGKYDICKLAGDGRAEGGPGATVTLVSTRAPPQEWKIKPYSRKYLDGLKAVMVKSVPNLEDAPQCTTRLNIPAMVIELGGLTGNYWHDFTDVLIPLFIGARGFNGEVQLLAVNLLPFWVDKYKKIFRQISRHDIIDFENDYGAVRCYPHVVVGYGSRKEFTIDPSLDKTGGGYSMVDFTIFDCLDVHVPIKLSEDRPAGRRRPRMMILERTNSRKFLNLQYVIAATEIAGFEVTVAGRPKATYDEFTREVNSFDVMVGVHGAWAGAGAGLTNCVFLPTARDIRPCSCRSCHTGRLENIARTDFGEPARDMGLRYIEYGVAADEISPMDVFGKEHPIIKDPVAVHMSGWQNVAEWYLGKQDLRINVERGLGLFCFRYWSTCSREFD